MMGLIYQNGTASGVGRTYPMVKPNTFAGENTEKPAKSMQLACRPNHEALTLDNVRIICDLAHDRA